MKEGRRGRYKNINRIPDAMEVIPPYCRKRSVETSDFYFPSNLFLLMRDCYLEDVHWILIQSNRTIFIQC